MPTEITPPQRRKRAEVLKAQPVIMMIGNRRYQLNTLVEITPLQPKPAPVIPIDRARKPR